MNPATRETVLMIPAAIIVVNRILLQLEKDWIEQKKKRIYFASGVVVLISICAVCGVSIEYIVCLIKRLRICGDYFTTLIDIKNESINVECCWTWIFSFFLFPYFCCFVTLRKLCHACHASGRPNLMSGSREKKKPTPIYCEESSNDFRLENSFANFVSLTI